MYGVKMVLLVVLTVTINKSYSSFSYIPGSKKKELNPGELRPVRATVSARYDGEACCDAPEAIDGGYEDTVTAVVNTEADHARVWLKVELDDTYAMGEIYIATQFYTDWYNSSSVCARNMKNYKSCKDDRSLVGIEVWNDGVLSGSCGILLLTYGKSRQDQVYKFDCKGVVGDTVQLSKLSGKITVVEISIFGKDAPVGQPAREFAPIWQMKVPARIAVGGDSAIACSVTAAAKDTTLYMTVDSMHYTQLEDKQWANVQFERQFTDNDNGTVTTSIEGYVQRFTLKHNNSEIECSSDKYDLDQVQVITVTSGPNQEKPADLKRKPEQADAKLELLRPGIDGYTLGAGSAATISCVLTAPKADLSLQLKVNGEPDPLKYHEHGWEYVMLEPRTEKAGSGLIRSIIEGSKTFTASDDGTDLECFSPAFNLRQGLRITVTFGNTNKRGKFLTDDSNPITKAPEPTKFPTFKDNDIRNNVAPDLKKDTVTGIEYWEPKISDPIPYNVLEKISTSENPAETPLGFLAYAGYIDYSLDKKFTGNRKDMKPRTKVSKEEVQTAIDQFLKFNGFVEGEEISDEMITYMKQPRCDNSDVEFSPRDELELCETMKSSDIKSSKRASTLPGKKSVVISKEAKYTSSYYYEVDVKFNHVKNNRSRAIFLGYNYDKGNQIQDFVALRFLNNMLCAQFGSLIGGTEFKMIPASRETIMKSCFTPSANEMITKAFKIRLDIITAYKNKPPQVFVAVRGIDVARNVVRRSVISSVKAHFHGDDHTLTMVRLCNRPRQEQPVQSNRAKRFVVSNHKWQPIDKVITFNFQNYSTILKQDGTRQAVLSAIELYTHATGHEFKEVKKTSSAMISFMFIRGLHADGMAFLGAGAKKAHAYAPVNSEIHFNDHELFSLKPDSDNSINLFYVAAHELGHSVGLKHSEKKKSALMAAGYPEKPWDFKELYDDDTIALNLLYNGNQPNVDELSNNEVEESISSPLGYIPKLPYPRECFNAIHAALHIGDHMYLVANPFVWRFEEKAGSLVLHDGYPKRVSDEFPSAGDTGAIFTVKHQKKGTLYVYVIVNQFYLRTYTYNEGEDGPYFSTYGSLVMKDFLTSGGVSVDTMIRSAFNWDGKTILVDREKHYYEVEWTEKAKVKSVTKSTDSSKLLGKELEFTDFNAAMEVKRHTKRKGDFQQIFNFGTRFFTSETIFPTENKNSILTRNSVEDYFGIEGWCPRNYN